MEQVVMDIENNLYNRPTYEDGEAESKALAPNVIMRGANAQLLEETEVDTDEIMTINTGLLNTKQYAWKRSKKEYTHVLMEIHQKETNGERVPKVRDILLVVGEEKNRNEWKNGE